MGTPRQGFASVLGCTLALAVTVFTFNKTDPPKLHCTQRSQGTFWPLEANQDSQALQKNAAAGDLWLCRGDYDWDAYFVQTTHFFKWQRLTVHVTPMKSSQSGAVTEKY